MTVDMERNFGEQPLARIMAEHELTPHDLVAASTEQLNHKMVSRACKGRRLTPNVQIKILNAVNRATGKEYARRDLFNYGGRPPTTPVLAWLLAFLVAIAAEATAQIRPRPAEWAQPMMGSRIENFYKVSDDVYRSEQPDDGGMKELEGFGMHSILNLRQFHSDADEAKQTAIKCYTVAMNAGEINDMVMEQALSAIVWAPKPVLIHCWHGSDRTGAVVAMYRMVFQNWPREKAIDEFMHGGFGYHERWYPNVEAYLKAVDVERFKARIAALHPAGDPPAAKPVPAAAKPVP